MSTAPVIPFLVFDSLLEETYGVLLAGIFVSCMLFGCVFLQVFLYYTSNFKDIFLIRTLPAFFVILEFIHQVLLCVAVYKVVINNFGNEGVTVLIVPELFVASFFQGVCATGAHLFYTYRIWKFSQGLWIVPCITIPLTLTQLGFTYANNILTLIHRDIAFLQTITFTVYVTHGVNIFLDMFFVIAMIILLSKEKQVFSQTQSMIRRLIVLVINTGLITTVATLLTIIFVGVQPTTFVYAFFNILISPLYGNSVMANLNSRQYIRGRNSHVSVTPSSIELNAFAINNSSSRGMTMSSPSGVGEKSKIMGGVSITKDTIISEQTQSTDTRPIHKCVQGQEDSMTYPIYKADESV